MIEEKKNSNTLNVRNFERNTEQRYSWRGQQQQQQQKKFVVVMESRLECSWKRIPEKKFGHMVLMFFSWFDWICECALGMLIMIFDCYFYFYKF